MGTLHEDQYAFLVKSRLILPLMKNVSNKICGENKMTHIIFIFFSKILLFMGQC
jgi:hypothetical protein